MVIAYVIGLALTGICLILLARYKSHWFVGEYRLLIIPELVPFMCLFWPIVAEGLLIWGTVFLLGRLVRIGMTPSRPPQKAENLKPPQEEPLETSERPSRWNSLGDDK